MLDQACMWTSAVGVRTPSRSKSAASQTRIRVSLALIGSMLVPGHPQVGSLDAR